MLKTLWNSVISRDIHLFINSFIHLLSKYLQSTNRVIEIMLINKTDMVPVYIACNPVGEEGEQK